MSDKLKTKLLIGREDVQNRINELGAQITKDYAKFDGNILAVCILKGSYMFFADLTRKIELDIELDFMSLASYGSGMSTSGEVQLIKDLDQSINGKHVIIVEDIIDSGITLAYLKRVLKSRKPASLKICTLLDKPECRRAEIEADYVGFKIGRNFVVGCGLDCAQKYRNIPDILEVVD